MLQIYLSVYHQQGKHLAITSLQKTPSISTMKFIHTIAFVTLVVIAGIDQFKEIFESFGIDFPETPSI